MQAPPELTTLLTRLTLVQQETILTIIANVSDEQALSQALQSHPDLLRALEAAALSDFSNDKPDELVALLQELSQPPKSLREIPHRTELCRRALAMIKMEENAAWWAILHAELANSLVKSPQGSKAENIEQAITHYRQALEVLTRAANSQLWAMVQLGLMAAYGQRIRGERGENLEQAIAHGQQVLQVFTREAYPAEWAQTKNNLANAYANRLRGERAENLEEARVLHEQVLEVRMWETEPVGWANTQLNLGAVYRERLCGDREKNLEQGIAHNQQALQVYTREAFPEFWAMAQTNLMVLYTDVTSGEREKNLEQAIAHGQQALQVFTREAYPAEWARTQSNMANTYAKQTENLGKAIVHYQQALQVYTRGTYPEDWAKTHYNLGNTFEERISGRRAENVGQAIAHYHQALQVLTLNLFPVNFQMIQRNLGYLYLVEGSWAAAQGAYQEAIHAGQILLACANTEAGQRVEVADSAGLYTHAAYALLKLGLVGEAMVKLEQGKTRLLSKALALNEIELNLLPEHLQEIFRGLRQTVQVLEMEMRLPADTPARRGERVLASALNQARGELNDLIKDIRNDHPNFMLEGLSLPEILALIPPHTALVAPIFTSQGSAVLVVPAGQHSVSMEQVLWLNDFTETELKHLFAYPCEGGSGWGGWLGAYLNANRRIKTWLDVIETTGQTLWTRLMAPIAERLATLQVTQVLLMPQGGLGLLPLHAAWHEVGGTRRYFLDDYSVTYLPSAYAHKVSLERMNDTQRHGRSLLAIINPTNDLKYATAEGEQVAGLFEKDKTTLLPNTDSDATVKTVTEQRSVGYVHFSCHGFYRWDDPMQSGLVLANREPFTLAQIIGKLNLNKTRLVTLSACETGITDISQSPDEYLGLPAGFLQAGAPAVVSSLWAVDDLSTMLLMERFYQLHLKEGQDVPVALRHAQVWLREVTAKELAQRFAGEEEALLSAMGRSLESASHYFTRFAAQAPEHRPFAHPYYWAAFTFSGA